MGTGVVRMQARKGRLNLVCSYPIHRREYPIDAMGVTGRVETVGVPVMLELAQPPGRSEAGQRLLPRARP